VAQEKDKTEAKKPAKTRVKKPQTVRERSLAERKERKRHLRTGASKVASPIKRVARIGRKEYHPVPVPDNKLGKILRKRVRLWPRFFGLAWNEIRQVTWPSRRETLRLTFAVFIFSLIFGISIALLDYGLDKLFKEVIIKK
jgi:preprotein translocase subunit SecE